MNNSRKKIVIVGAGFGGLQTALGLEKKFGKSKNVSITLIDKRDYHLFTPNLYEVATAAEELTTIAQIKKSITLPINKILQGKNIEFINSSVVMVEPANKLLKLPSKSVNYDYLVLAIGSKSDYFNIEGAEQYALTLKDFPDALRIRNKIDFVISSQQYELNKKPIKIVLAGGGYTSLELATELKGLVDFLSWKYQVPREKIEIEVIEANNKLIAGFSDRLSQDAYNRLQELGIHVRLSSKISKIDEHFAELSSGEKIIYDALIWVAGVKACSMPSSNELNLDKKDRLHVNEYLQVQNYNNIFALGDTACVMGQNDMPVPSTAQDAWKEAQYLVKAIPYLMQNKRPPKPFLNHKHGFIVNLGGKWAIVDFYPFYVKGIFGAIINLFAHIRYYKTVVGLWKGIKWLVFQVDIYRRND